MDQARGFPSKGVAVLVCATLLASTGGCTTFRGTESARSQVRLGMTKGEVRGLLGDPAETYPVPGQGPDLRLPVEMWHFVFDSSDTIFLLAAFTVVGVFILILALPFTDPFVKYSFDVGFNAEERVQSVSPVVEGG